MSSPTPGWQDGEAPMAPVFTGTARFSLRRTLGEGGMGVVYEAWDQERGMAVALKTLRHLDGQSLFSLKTEFRTLADIEHRNLVRLGELMHDGGHWFFTMELVDGQSFREWLTSEPPVDHGDTSQEIAFPVGAPERRYDERRLRAALRQLAGGLDTLHRADKVHRDLKPSNILVTPKDRVVILDLGLAADLAPRDASDQTAVGTAAYVAPEQAMSAAASPASDWYSFGVILFEALTGRLPIDGTPLEILVRKQHETPVASALVDAPHDLAALCLELLAIDPTQRPNGAAVLQRLAASRAGSDELGPSRSPFVGRAAELVSLGQSLSDVEGGAAATVRIEGASGIGKSALVRHFVEHTVRPRRPESLVLTGRCHERESVPFKGLDGVIDAVARAMVRLELGESALPPPAETAALAQLFPVLMRVPAISRVSATLPENPFELRARAFRGLRLLLRKLASRRLVVITIDDVQWADADTLLLLRELLHAPGAPRLLVVVTWRGDGAPPALSTPVRVIELSRLSQAEAEGLVTLVAPERAADAAALATAADGHPMFLRELLRHAAPPRQVRLDDALWARITRMDVTARRILELVAVAGRPLPQSLVVDALGLEPRTTAKWLGVLRAASLVRTGGARGSDPVEPYHDRVRAAVVARVAPARRRRYHARLAAALTASGLVDKDPLAVVTHLEAAGMRTQAAHLARRTSNRRGAARAPAFEQVAALCDAALRLGADGGDRDIRRQLLIERAEALACAGRGPEAAAAYLSAAGELDGEDAFHSKRSAAEQLLVSGHTGEGLRLLREVIDAVGLRYPPSPTAAKRALIRRVLWVAIRGTKFKARESYDPQVLRRFEVCRAASLGLGMVDPVIGAGFCAQALITALKIGDARRVTYALSYHAMYVAAGGDRLIAGARAMAARANVLATECRSRLMLAMARSSEGIVEYFAGNLIHAIDVMVDAEEQLRNHTYGTAGELDHLRMFLLFAMRRHGGFGELRVRYDEYLRDALRRGDRYAATTFRWSANVVWLAADDSEHAHADLEAATWNDPHERLHLQHWFHARAVTELALYDGDDARLDEAEASLRRFLGGVMDHVQIVRAETSIELARIHIRRGEAAAATAQLDLVARDEAAFIRALANLGYAAVATMRGDRATARHHLERAIADAAYELPVLGALARFRLAPLLGGSAGARLTAEAEATLLHHGVVSPARFAAAFATWPARTA